LENAMNINRYTRELTRLLLVHLPPNESQDGMRCYGLTGNLLPVIVKVNSKRKFEKLNGWYYTYHTVTNIYAKLSERMELHEVDEKIIRRIAYRVWTTEYPQYDFDNVITRLSWDDAFADAVYITVLDVENARIFLFYISQQRKNKLQDLLEEEKYRRKLGRIKLKKFEFSRFNKRIANYATTDIEVLDYLFQ